ncbi:MFS transporter [Streptomyces anthocyanicus]|uniref:MFS transporter n=1 Tax=Streptomyces anthocyanicus TaxID=68174 RepID=UPI002243D452|nr:MFS transporter [Streptomyces anthocyanicus]MCW8122453.1 MFS transporter [Streptomyces anthocyanicus]
MTLAGTAVAFMSLYLGAGALTPLLVTYKEQWHFEPSMLNVAFAVYALGFLVAVLTLGSLSDHLGRRPVLIGSLIVQVASNFLFLLAPDISWVIIGRIVQGIASGAATSAFTAALVEIAPEDKKRLGTILGSVSLTGGLAAGSLLAGLAIQITRSANTIIFIALIVLTVVGGLVVVASRETVTRSAGALRSIVPRVSIPPAVRKEFIAAAPVVAAVWMLAGLSGGLAPNMVRSVFHLESGLLNGIAGFVAPAVAAFIGLSFARVNSRRAMSIGIYASIIGAVGIISGVFAGSLAIMITGQAIAGVGFGASFTAALRLIFPLAEPYQRAGVVAAIYLVSYLAFGLPIVVEGQLVEPLGEIPAVVCYTTLTIILAFISLVAQARLKRHA